MIAIVSSLSREADALVALCEQQSWPSQACRGLTDLVRIIDQTQPRVVIVRHRLADGYSDDVFALLGRTLASSPVRVVVLAPADCPAKEERRQISLGADVVFRDPVRTEVLLEMISRYRKPPPGSQAPAAAPEFQVAGVRVSPLEHRLTRGARQARATPKVIEFLRILHRHAGRVVPYAVLYDELFGRRFCGDTSNCRVLLVKTDQTFKGLGVPIRRHIEVIPKSGYLYRPMTIQPDSTQNW